MGHLDLFKIFSNKFNINPSENSQRAFINAINGDHFDIFNECLKDEKINLTLENNAAIRAASNYQRTNVKIARVLFNKEDVKKLLLKTNQNLYEKLSKTFLNEAINNF